MVYHSHVPFYTPFLVTDLSGNVDLEAALLRCGLTSRNFTSRTDSVTMRQQLLHEEMLYNIERKDHKL